MMNTDRMMDIVARRKRGEKYKAIGQIYGIGKERVGQIWRQYLWIEEHKNDNLPLQGLSLRTINALVNHGLKTRQQVMEAFSKGLLNPTVKYRTRNRIGVSRLGFDGYSEICNWLQVTPEILNRKVSVCPNCGCRHSVGSIAEMNLTEKGVTDEHRNP